MSKSLAAAHRARGAGRKGFTDTLVGWVIIACVVLAVTMIVGITATVTTRIPTDGYDMPDPTTSFAVSER